MPVSKKYQRQQSKHVMIELGVANMGAGNGASFQLPLGALLLSMLVLTDVAFNSATTSTATVTDGTTVFANAVDTKTAGSETVAGAPKYYPNGGTITASLAETGATATAGRVFVVAEYVINGASDGVYGDSNLPA